MKKSWWQRRFAVPGAQEVVRERFLARGEGVGNGGLYGDGEGCGTAGGGLGEREKLE